MIISLLLAQAQLARMAQTPTAYADTILLPPSFILDQNAAIDYWANLYHAPADEMRATIQCESKNIPDAIGDHGHSFGLVQIYLPSHPFITKKQALDPDWSLQYMASHWHADHWSCRSILGFSDP